MAPYDDTSEYDGRKRDESGHLSAANGEDTVKDNGVKHRRAYRAERYVLGECYHTREECEEDKEGEGSEYKRHGRGYKHALTTLGYR